MDEKDFSIDIPVVHIKTDSFSADAIEMYEMPSKMVMPLIGNSGPEQMEEMLSVFKLAIIDQSKIAELDSLSFNEVANVLMEWWVGSTMRIEAQTKKIESRLEELGAEIDFVMNQLEASGDEDEEDESEIGIASYELDGMKMNFKITQSPDGSIEIQMLDGPADNDPGDGISPFDV